MGSNQNQTKNHRTRGVALWGPCLLCGLQLAACNPLGSSYVDGGFSGSTGTSSDTTPTSGGSGSCTAGTASAGDVLAGLTFPDGSGSMTTGTMANRGAFNLTGAFTAGYVSSLTGLSAANVCSTTSILGSTGTAVCQSGNRLFIETAADGSGSVVTTASAACPGTLTLYSILRSATGAFVSNPSVTWYANGNSSLSASSGTSTVVTYRGTSYVAASSAATSGFTTQALTPTGICDPSTITGLQLWLAAGSGITVDGSNGVSSWVDQSSNGSTFTQGAAANRPVRQTNVVNSLPVVRFTAGSSTFITGTGTGLPIGSAARSVFAVLSHASPGSAMEVGGWGSVNSGGQRFGLYLNTNLMLFEQANGGTSQSVAVPDSSFMIYSFVYGAGTSIAAAANAVFKNGTQDTTAGSAGTPGTSDTTFELGRIVNFNGGYWSGDMAEFIVYDSMLSTTNRETVECFLSTKYGIAIGHGC